MIKRVLNISLFLCIALAHSLCISQITFENQETENIKIGKVGNINAFVKEITQDSLLVSWKVSDLTATGSSNIFMAYDSETHNVEFGTTYDDLENLNLWIEQRQKTKTGGKVTLGEWELSYVQSALGIPIFMWTGPTGNFEGGINSEMRLRLMTKRCLQRAIEKHNQRKLKEENRKSKRNKKG